MEVNEKFCVMTKEDELMVDGGNSTDTHLYRSSSRRMVIRTYCRIFCWLKKGNKNGQL